MGDMCASSQPEQPGAEESELRMCRLLLFSVIVVWYHCVELALCSVQAAQEAAGFPFDIGVPE